MAENQVPQTNATVTMFHRMLGIGATLLAVVMVFLRSKADPPLVDDQSTSVIAYLFASISLVGIAVAIMVLTRRVPERSITQPVDAYWAAPGVLPAANLVWFVLEGAAILAIVGYYMTGHLAPAATMVVGLGVFWWMGPKTFSKS